MKQPNRDLYVWATALIITAACIQLAFFSRSFYAVSWDESARTLDAYSWAKHGVAQTPEWLPFYRVLVGFGLIAFPNLFLTPRIICFLFGIAVIPAAACLAQEIFQNRKVTITTLILVTFTPHRIALSLSPLSEIMFILVILIATAFFARWSRTNSRTSLMLSAVSAAFAGTIRYEGWLFGAAMFAIMELYRRTKPARLPTRDRLLAGILLFTFPLVWSAGTLLREFAVVVAGARQYSIVQVLRRNPFVDFVFANALSLNLIGIVSVFELFRLGTARFRAIIAIMFAPLLAASLLFLFSRAAATGASWRITAVWSILLTPFTAFLLTEWEKRFGKRASSLATLILLTAFLLDTNRIEKASAWAFPLLDRDAGVYLDRAITADPGAKILVESSTYAYLNIEVAAQHPDSFVMNSVPEQQDSARILSSGASNAGTLKRQGIKFLVFRGDDYKRFLNRSSEVVKLKDFGSWSIYRLMPS